MSDAGSADRDARVSRRAYELWEQEGGKHGHHDDHWHRAAAEHDAAGDGQVAVASPDGTTLTVPTDEVEGDAKPARKRAAPKAKAEPAASTPAKALDKAAPKPRKPKAK